MSQLPAHFTHKRRRSVKSKAAPLITMTIPWEENKPQLKGKPRARTALRIRHSPLGETECNSRNNIQLLTRPQSTNGFILKDFQD